MTDLAGQRNPSHNPSVWYNLIMLKSELKVLIVDDDPTLSESLKALVAKAGFNAVAIKNPTEALQVVKTQPIAAMIVDCLLPKISGVDFCIQAKAESPSSLTIILMSGVFKDRSFINDALQKTGAVAFLSKPFDPNELLRVLEEQLGSSVHDDLDPIWKISTKQNPSPGERIDTIKSLTSIHGFQLPHIISLLINSGSQGPYRIDLVDSDNKSAQIHFAQGKIVQVVSQDRQSFFGALVIERNLVKHEVLEMVMNAPNPEKKRVGERLVEANVLSPHMINLINTDQIGIRLSQLVADISYDLKLIEGESGESEGHFDKMNLSYFLSDSISSKISINWIKTYYLKWMANPIRFTTQFDKNHPVFSYGILARIQNFSKEFKEGVDLQSLLNKFPQQQDDVFCGIHLLLISGLVYFQDNTSEFDQNSMIVRLKLMKKELDNKDDFEILGLPKKTKSSDVKKAYYDLSKTFHPDKLSPSANAELVSLTKEVFSKITSAYNHLSDDEKRALYLKELEHGQAEKVLQAETLFDEGKGLMKVGQATKALDKFKQAAKLRPPHSELHLHILWAELVTLSSQAHMKDEILNRVTAGLDKIPPEDRHNALYYFVKGLYLKHKGDLETAFNTIANAVSIRPEFIEAKRELHLLELQQKSSKPVDIFKSDLKDVVGLLFKKKR